ncbi:MAG: tetratricopeptide repeat protein, partial [Anaerolineales bacterium]|nr:tetratricopeptide repeat protein [Anaerolineales bacterium]
LSRITRGRPLAIHVVADELNQGTSLKEVIQDIAPFAANDQIARRMADRYLQHVIAEEDKQAIFALVLADGDVEILRAMIKNSGRGKNDLENLLKRLERDYAYVHAERARLHDDPALFIREYLKNGIRRTGEMVQNLVSEAIAIGETRLQTTEKQLNTAEDRCNDENWINEAVSLANFLLWRNEEAAWKWILPRFAEGLEYNPDVCYGLLTVLTRWQDQLSDLGRQILHHLMVVQEEIPSIAAELKLLESFAQAEEKGWLEGNMHDEYLAIFHLRHGRVADRQQLFDQAYDHYKQAEQHLPADGEMLRHRLGEAMSELAQNMIQSQPDFLAEQQETIEAILTKVLAMTPQNQHAMLILSQLYLEKGQWQAAQPIVQALTELVPDHPESWTMLGDIQRMQAQWPAAKKSYNKALELDEQALEAWIGLGHVHVAQNQDKQAQQAFEKAYALNPLAPDVLVGLGNLYVSQQAWAEAQAMYEQALTADCQTAAVYTGLGHAY